MSDKKKYVINYILSAFEFVTRFLWIFLAIPKITDSLSLEVYGLYMAVLSFAMFLSYVDFGFMSAAQKFGCDEYLKGDRRKEMELLSSAAFMQLMAFAVFALIMVVLAMNPPMVISGLDKEGIFLSRTLFILLAIFSFVSIPRSIVSFIAQFRIELYRVKAWEILFNLINIVLVFIIFSSKASMSVVYYYLCSNVAMLFMVIGLGLFLFRKWHYSIREFLLSFKLNKSALKHLWPFAKASFISSLLYVLYYELDKVYIAKFLSADQLAFYVIGVSLMTGFRSLSGALNSPYIPKYNQYYVNNDDKGMKNFYFSHLSVVSPFIFIPVIVCVILMPQVVISWVGEKFAPSIGVAQILVGSYIMAPFIDCSSYIVTAKVKLSAIYVSGIITTVSFWGIVVFLSDRYGIQAVAWAKFVSTFVSGIYFIVVAHKIIGVRFFDYGKRILAPFLVACILAGALGILFRGLEVTRSKLYLLEMLSICGSVSLVTLLFYACVSRQFRLAIGSEHFDIRKLKNKVLSKFKACFYKLDNMIKKS